MSDRRPGPRLAEHTARRVQRPCAEAAPQSTLLEPAGDGRSHIVWYHPDYGRGCLKALADGYGAGLLEPMDLCADGSLFTIEPAGEHPAAQKGAGAEEADLLGHTRADDPGWLGRALVAATLRDRSPEVTAAVGALRHEAAQLRAARSCPHPASARRRTWAAVAPLN
jgi:hypothetical protein